MQVRSEKKRSEIMAAAARLFATRPFHEVRLEHVAATAHVGKGTLYVYFRSKDELYAAVVAEGIAALVDAVDARLAAGGGALMADLESVIDALFEHARRHPDLFALLRSGHPIAADQELLAQRARLACSIERLLRAGIDRGEVSDPHPELTAHYLLSMVRAALLFGPTEIPRSTVARHILGLLRDGLSGATSGSRARPRRGVRPAASRRARGGRSS